jgi:hypothetical protein
MSYNTVISRAGAEVSGWIQRKLQSIVSKLSGKQMKMTIVFKESA